MRHQYTCLSGFKLGMWPSWTVAFAPDFLGFGREEKEPIPQVEERLGPTEETPCLF